jgi:hypothetical protein
MRDANTPHTPMTIVGVVGGFKGCPDRRAGDVLLAIPAEVQLRESCGAARDTDAQVLIPAARQVAREMGQ